MSSALQPRRLRVAFVTNFCQYYRVKLFESLARLYDVEFFFFSAGDESYWLPEHGVAQGNFKHHDIPGLRVLRTSINPTLVPLLWRGQFDVFVSGVVGKFAMPATYAVARAQGRPFVLWTQIWMRLATPIHRVIFPATRFVYRHADAVVASGEHVKSYLVSEGVGAEHIFSCDEATDNELYNQPVAAERVAALRRQLAVHGDDKIILFIGRIEEEKGLPYLIDAFAGLRRRDAVLVIAGKGNADYEQMLKQRVQQLGINDRVRFPGFVPNHQTPDYYASAWVYVLPSITTAAFKEPWGLVINEAFNQGVPAIVSDSVGAAAGGMLKDGSEGLVVRERDVPALEHALQRVLDDEAFRQRLGETARRTIQEWNIERMLRGFQNAIDYVSVPTTLTPALSQGEREKANLPSPFGRGLG